MQASTLIGNILNIRANEYAHTLRMLLHAFFSGLGIALAFTGINVLLLEQHGSQNLPGIYMLSSIVLLLVGVVYSKLEHRIQPGKLFVWMMLFSSAWTLLTALLLKTSDSLALLIALYCGYFVLYLFNNLEFWGTAAMLYDVRQGKRLFGLLSSGESLAKILGYSLTPIIVKWFQIENLLTASALAFAASAWLIFQIVRKNKNSFELGHHKHHGTHAHHQSKELKYIQPIVFIRKIFNDNFNRNIAFFAVLSTLVYYSLHYGFLEKIEERYDSQHEIAAFFGLFFTIAKTLNLLMKGFFSGRLLSFLGIRIMIMILPLSIFLINLTGLSGMIALGSGGLFLMFVFGANMMADEVFRTSLHKPSYLVLFQPFAKNKRLEGHTMTKGVMEPVGMGLAGLFLWALTAMKVFTLESLVIYTSIISGIWVISTFKTTRAYKNILNDALKKRLIGKHTYRVSREEADLIKNHKIHASDPAERLYAIKIGAEHLEESIIQSTLKKLLDEPSEGIVTDVLNEIAQRKIRPLADDVLALARTAKNESVKTRAVSCYASLLEAECVDVLLAYFSQESGSVKLQAISQILKQGGLYGATKVGTHLLSMVDSIQAHERIDAAKIVGKVGKIDYYPIVLRLMHDEDASVVTAALDACLCVQHEKLAIHLIDLLHHKAYYPSARKALKHYGPAIIPLLNEKLNSLDKEIEKDQKIARKLLSLLSEVEHGEAYILLSNYSSSGIEILRTESILGMARMRPFGTKSIQKSIRIMLTNERKHLESLINFEKSLLSSGAVLCLNSEQLISKRRILALLSLKHNNSRIFSLEDHLLRGDTTSKSVALELLENSLDMSDSRLYVHKFEKDPLQKPEDEDRYEDDLSFLGYLLQQGAKGMSQNWSLAYLLRLCADRHVSLTQEMLLHLELQKSDMIQQELKRMNALWN